MSYDIWLEIDTGGEDRARVWDGWNFTSNVSGMWRAAGTDLAEHHDKKAGDVSGELEAAITELEANPVKYKAMDSPNKWGTYDDLVPALKRLLAAYREHPLATVQVWR